MRILLFGRDGQLGWELNRTLYTIGELSILEYPDIDFKDPKSLRQIVHFINPNIIVNAIAYTNVDEAEQDSKTAYLINAESPKVLSQEAGRLGAVLIHISTDYVFNGDKQVPYTETDIPNPINEYSRSKLAGEIAVMGASGAPIILRTSWMYSNRRHNFALSVLEWSRQRKVVSIPDDQTGSPTWARSLAEIIGQLIARTGQNLDWLATKTGVYHIAGEGATTRYEFAKAVLAMDPHPEKRIMTELKAEKLCNFHTPANRPLYSALDNTLFVKTFNLTLPPWQESLRLMMECQ